MLTPRSSSKEFNNPFIIEIGSFTTRAGMAGS